METTLDAIKAALEGFDPNTFYGTAAKLPKDAPWDYTVFSRQSTGRTSGKTGCTDAFEVAVVREDYVPEGTLEAVVAAMESIPGMRLSAQDVEYVYDVKPGTTDTVEMMVARFSKARKG